MLVAEETSTLAAAVVTDLQDPLGLGRVRVMFPHLGGVPSAWARLVSPMAGRERGVFFRPEVNDEVLVGFEHGNPLRPYILGSLWNKEDPPPPRAAEAPKDNHLRFIHSRSGHILRFDDTPGAERIEIIASDGARRILLDVAAKKIEVSCDVGNIDVITKSGTVKVDATQIQIHAQTISIQADSLLELKGGLVDINPT